VKIDNVDLGEKPIILAPMEDVTDPSFRYLCKRFGADMMFTEFVNSDGLIRDASSCQQKLNIYEHERPIGIQLYGHIIESMVEACKLAAEVKPDVIDINFGCPVKKIANRGAGSGMMKDIPKMVEMTKQIVNATNIPVTVKTRLGWDDDSKFIVSIAEQLQDVGIKALTIHGRTRAQLYRGEADWTLIGEVKSNPRMNIPIIGNGDIDSPEKAAEMFNRYGVDAIMIGRATYGRPWIFKEVKHYLQTGEKMKPFTVEEKVAIAKEHLLKSIEFKGERRGILELRRHLTSYFKGLPNFKELRLKLVTSNCPNELTDLLTIVADRYAGFTQDETINPSPWSV
jgi:tRNA-dihydrouridine synthase B